MVKTEKFLRFEENPGKSGKNPEKIRKKSGKKGTVHEQRKKIFKKLTYLRFFCHILSYFVNYSSPSSKLSEKCMGKFYF